MDSDGAVYGPPFPLLRRVAARSLSFFFFPLEIARAIVLEVLNEVKYFKNGESL